MTEDEFKHQLIEIFATNQKVEWIEPTEELYRKTEEALLPTLLASLPDYIHTGNDYGGGFNCYSVSDDRLILRGNREHVWAVGQPRLEAKLVQMGIVLINSTSNGDTHITVSTTELKRWSEAEKLGVLL